MNGPIKIVVFDRDQTLYDEYADIGGHSLMDPEHEVLINAMEGHLFPGVEDMLRAVKAQEYITALATSGHQQGADLFADKKRLRDVFSRVSGGKNKAEVIDELAKQYGLQPYQVMMVDDQHDFHPFLGYHMQMRRSGASAARGPLIVPAWSGLNAANLKSLQRDIDNVHCQYPGTMFIQAVTDPMDIVAAIDRANAEIEKDLRAKAPYVPNLVRFPG